MLISDRLGHLASVCTVGVAGLPSTCVLINVVADPVELPQSRYEEEMSIDAMCDIEMRFGVFG